MVGDRISCCTRDNPSTICARRFSNNALVHLSVAYISASADDLAVTDCCFDTQCSGPPNHNKYSDIDCDWNSGSCFC